MTRAGLSVLRARNGADAVARVQDALANRQRFELVLMDIHTPAQANHGRRSWRSPPTTFAEDRAAYLEAGLDDYLAKPFEKADLAALLARGACEKLAAARREHEISAGAPL